MRDPWTSRLVIDIDKKHQLTRGLRYVARTISTGVDRALPRASYSTRRYPALSRGDAYRGGGSSSCGGPGNSEPDSTACTPSTACATRRSRASTGRRGTSSWR